MAWIKKSGILILLLDVLGFFDDCIGTSPHINPYSKEKYSNCISGFLNGVDRYIYNGTIDASQASSIRRVVYFEMQSSLLTGYTKICGVTIYPNCSTNQALDGCYCGKTTSSTLELFLNKTADIQFSDGTVRIFWANSGQPQDDISNIEQVPVVYSEPVETLKINNNTVSLDNCNFQLATSTSIEWCVTGLSSHVLTLNLSSKASQNECIIYNYTSSNATNTPIYFSLSYLELDGCKRNKTRICSLDYVSATTIIPTLNTTSDVSTTAISTSNISSVTPAPNQTISDEFVGVLSTHVVCTVTLIGISIIVLMNNLVSMPRQQRTYKRLKYLDWLCLLIILFEIAQIILVIIAGIKFNGEGKTTLDIWKIMIIYQVLVNIIFIIIESSIFGINAKSNGFQVTSLALLYIITLICIHTVIGIIAVPFLWLYLANATPKPKENSPSVDENNDSRYNKEKKKTHPDIDSNHEINAPYYVQENTQELSDQPRQKKRKKISEKSRKEHNEKQTVLNENDNTRIGTASEIKLNVAESNDPLETKDNILYLQTNKDMSIFKKRPTSIEVTEHPDNVNPRRLPSLNLKKK